MTVGADAYAARAGLFCSAGRVPLLGVEIRAEVVAGHARAVVRQRYRNDESRPVEAVYTFPLPTRAALTGFTMTVEGRRLEGEVHEREEAFQRYDDAIAAGHGAALLEQERPNVFTANVGNLLPGEETVIEIEYVEPVQADEGTIRWAVPTLVAPRYMPGAPSGDRTGHGSAEPTTRVPDADRISPPTGDARYGLSLEVVFDVGAEVDVESPSHAIAATRRGERTIVTLAQREVALDRDVVVTAVARSARSELAPLASVVAHRAPGRPGALALSIVPDLGAVRRRDVSTDVVFVLDRSGSMGGSSMEEARTALRLCLRQLREGDRFAVLAFDDVVEHFESRLVPFTQATLRKVDRWLDGVDARGGTELLEPLARAVDLAPNGVVVLLTDGQVGNEDEILRAVLARRAGARVYCFGIGTNVSDALLESLAKETGGASCGIFPGERVDEKVIAQFARATAARVTDLEVRFRGVDVGELAPGEPTALVDGEPFTLFGTYEEAGRGAVEIRGRLDGERFFLELPVDLPEAADRPVVEKLWAKARIVDLEKAALTGRRADAMKARIVRLAKEHGVSSRYTSFVVVEKRTGDRRANAMPETRVVPVAPPAGWAMFQGRRMRMASLGAPPPPAPAMRIPAPGRGVPRPAAAMPREVASKSVVDMAQFLSSSGAYGSRPASFDEGRIAEEAEASASPTGAPAAPGGGDPIVDVLARQAASGLWEESGRGGIGATIDAMLALLRAGVSAAHPVHGALVKKAVAALLEEIERTPPADVAVLELALALAWLLSSGRRTRAAVEGATRARGELAALVPLFGRDVAVRERVEELAAAAHRG